LPSLVARKGQEKGNVARGTDTRLGREVAIKVLPAAFAADPDRMERFQREARVLASLNHPNIAAIYGIEDRALVMELVEGRDLRGPLPVATALHYAGQIAGALAFAHEKGHRASRSEARQYHAAPNTNVSASRDGERAVFVSTRSGGQHIWMKDLRSGAETQLTAGDAAKSFPSISADGNQVAYATREGEKWSVDAVSLDARGRSGAEQRLCEGCRVPTSWSLDAKRLLYVVFPQANIGLLDFAAGFRGDVVRYPKHDLWQDEFSPDGRWVAFMASAGRPAWFVVPRFAVRDRNPCLGRRRMAQCIRRHDIDEAGRSDGNLLYFISERDGFRCLWAQRLDVRAKRPSGAPVAVQHFHSSRLSLMDVDYSALEISITRHRVVFSAGEVTGNIWAAEILDAK
jgi:hypothetical protein